MNNYAEQMINSFNCATKQIVAYPGGVTIVTRQDKPELQCDDCSKPSWFDQHEGLFISCEYCNGHLSLITVEEPFRHR